MYPHALSQEIFVSVILTHVRDLAKCHDSMPFGRVLLLESIFALWAWPWRSSLFCKWPCCCDCNCKGCAVIRFVLRALSWLNLMWIWLIHAGWACFVHEPIITWSWHRPTWTLSPEWTYPFEEVAAYSHHHNANNRGEFHLELWKHLRGENFQGHCSHFLMMHISLGSQVSCLACRGYSMPFRVI